MLHPLTASERELLLGGLPLPTRFDRPNSRGNGTPVDPLADGVWDGLARRTTERLCTLFRELARGPVSAADPGTLPASSPGERLLWGGLHPSSLMLGLEIEAGLLANLLARMLGGQQAVLRQRDADQPAQLSPMEQRLCERLATTAASEFCAAIHESGGPMQSVKEMCLADSEQAWEGRVGPGGGGRGLILGFRGEGFEGRLTWWIPAVLTSLVEPPGEWEAEHKPILSAVESAAGTVVLASLDLTAEELGGLAVGDVIVLEGVRANRGALELPTGERWEGELGVWGGRKVIRLETGPSETVPLHLLRDAPLRPPGPRSVP